MVLLVIDALSLIRFSSKYPNLYHGIRWQYKWLCDELKWRKENYYYYPRKHRMDT